MQAHLTDLWSARVLKIFEWGSILMILVAQRVQRCDKEPFAHRL